MGFRSTIDASPFLILTEPSQVYNKILYFATIVALHDTFSSIVEACEAINRHVLDDGESY
jgi:hypothetical protein